MNYGYNSAAGPNRPTPAALALWNEDTGKGVVMRKSSGLPTRFPPGTKYVLESRGAGVHRFVELPDGRRFALPTRKAQTCNAADVSLVPSLPPAKIAARAKRRSRAFA